VAKNLANRYVGGGDGGGIYLNSGLLTAVNATIAYNTDETDNGPLYSPVLPGPGGGLYDQPGSTATLYNTIIARNTVNHSGFNDDIGGGPVSSASEYNLIGIGGSGGLVD
jgi:hypothetical protein